MLGLRKRNTFANVCSILALMIAVSGGTAYAVNEWTGENIVDGSLTAADLAAKSVRRSELAANAVDSAKIADDQVTGADVQESTLAQVPSADWANNSNYAYNAGFAYSVAADSVGPYQLIANPPWRYIGDAGQPPFLNSWSNYDTHTSHVDATWQQAGFYRDNLGVIHLGGLVKGGAVPGAVFHLPQYYCPWFYHAYPVLANNGLARVTVTWMTPGCDVIVEFGSNAWVSLDGISWRDGYEEDTLTGKPLEKEMARRRALTDSGASPALPGGR